LRPELLTWFAQRPTWLQDALRRLVTTGAVDNSDLDELVILCKSEAGIPSPTGQPTPQPLCSLTENAQVSPSLQTWHLAAVSDVSGVNALAPRNALRLAEGLGSLTIVYGRNGSGKSGYVRALKHASGARNPGNLYGNVFSKAKQPVPSCSFELVANDGSTKKVSWNLSSGAVPELRCMAVYDAPCASLYMNEDNELSFEPSDLSLISRLVEVCTAVAKQLQAEIATKGTSRLAKMPEEYASTEAAKWYTKIGSDPADDEIGERCSWDSAKASELDDLKRQLSEPDPALEAAKLRTHRNNVETLIRLLEEMRSRLSNERYSEYVEARADAIKKRKVAQEIVANVLTNTKLDGVGKESWIELWRQARNYSEEWAYKGKTFPHVGGEARCVLCQQPLSPDAKTRMVDFEAHVSGEVQTQASAAEARANHLASQFGDAFSSDRLTLLMDAADITDTTIRTQVSDYCARLESRRLSIVDTSGEQSVIELPDAEVISKLRLLSEELGKQAGRFDQAAVADNRNRIEKQALELEARQWLSQQSDHIRAEVRRLAEIRYLRRAVGLTNTQPLSAKKSDLVKDLVTPEYLQRFNDILRSIGAGHIRVSVEQSKVRYGHAYYRVMLRDSQTKVSVSEVLSDGEFRIVSLAAFMADITGNAEKCTVVFDDPVSSLDQDYEEAVAAYLVDLATKRQVLVFTHRLSLFALLTNAADKAGQKPATIALRAETWGVGEPGETLMNERRLNKRLNSLLSETLPKARKARAQQGQAEYEAIVKQITSDFRILLERLVESVLLCGVVERFRRDVQTKNKILHLAKITLDDCKLFDDLMTKYSRYEHSQPLELPVVLPNPGDLEKDLLSVQKWISEFNKR
jgi:hypothetical protein